MSTGPECWKRPADVIGNAVRVMQIVAGETYEKCEGQDHGKDKAAQTLERKGGKARTEKMTAEQRTAIARKAAATRWNKLGISFHILTLD